MNIHAIYRIIFKIWRVKRMRVFEERIAPQPDENILDVGGHPDTWSRKITARKIIIINTYPLPAAPSPNRIESLVGDGCSLEYKEGAFDIVFSNSVIEHVGSFDQQQKFAREVRRVGRRLWIQTPAQECPLEPHYLAPFVHWLPPSYSQKLLRWFTPWGWMTKPSPEAVAAAIQNTQLLTRNQFAKLFPDCEIYTEKLFFILPKSYIAIRAK